MNTKVNIKVPLKLIASGLNLSNLMPKEVADKLDSKIGSFGGIDFSMASGDIVTALQDLEVNVESDTANVKVYCE